MVAGVRPDRETKPGSRKIAIRMMEGSPGRNARAIIQRVIERGTPADWRATRTHDGDETMRKAATSRRWLSPQDIACVRSVGSGVSPAFAG